MTMFATYTDTGHLTVTDSGVDAYLGDIDADGGEWAALVDQRLAEHGYVRTGSWAGDAAPVRRA